MSSRSSFLAELKRRKVFKVGAAYLVVAWLVIQVVATVAPQMQLPDWLPRAVTLILVVGFPIALVLSWLFDATPAGVVRDPVDAANVVPVAGTHTATVLQKSIAVLAFADLSPAHDQEYFSDGMAEEILNALAKIKDLKVAGRTSSFYYKGRNEDLRGIGKTLGVANLLEGSVRKQGDRVLITAQLVRSDDGFHLWSGTYDGDLNDVFELQDRIARAIAEKLDLILHGDQHRQLVAVATENPEAYALCLQAASIFNRREGPRVPEAIVQLNEALRLDPKFARGHARLAALYVLATSYRSDGFDANLEAGEQHARLALELDPRLAEPHLAIGLICGQRRQFADQLAANERALALDPADANANYWNAVALVCAGYSRRGNELLDQSLAIARSSRSPCSGAVSAMPMPATWIAPRFCSGALRTSVSGMPGSDSRWSLPRAATSPKSSPRKQRRTASICATCLRVRLKSSPVPCTAMPTTVRWPTCGSTRTLRANPRSSPGWCR